MNSTKKTSSLRWNPPQDLRTNSLGDPARRKAIQVHSEYTVTINLFLPEDANVDLGSIEWSLRSARLNPALGIISRMEFELE